MCALTCLQTLRKFKLSTVLSRCHKLWGKMHRRNVRSAKVGRFKGVFEGWLCRAFMWRVIPKHVPQIRKRAETTLPAESHQEVKAILEGRQPRLYPPLCELAYLLSPRHRASAFRARGFPQVRTRMLHALFPGSSEEQSARRASLYKLIGTFATMAWMSNVSKHMMWSDENTVNAREWWRGSSQRIAAAGCAGVGSACHERWL